MFSSVIGEESIERHEPVREETVTIGSTRGEICNTLPRLWPVVMIITAIAGAFMSVMSL